MVDWHSLVCSSCHVRLLVCSFAVSKFGRQNPNQNGIRYSIVFILVNRHGYKVHWEYLLILLIVMIFYAMILYHRYVHMHTEIIPSSQFVIIHASFESDVLTDSDHEEQYFHTQSMRQIHLKQSTLLKKLNKKQSNETLMHSLIYSDKA